MSSDETVKPVFGKAGGGGSSSSSSGSGDSFNFKIDPKAYFGLENEKFRAIMLQLALSKPTEYFAMRLNVTEEVKAKLVDDMYETFYYLMSDGNTNKRSDPGSDVFGGYRPCIPPQLVNEFSLKVSKTISKIAEEAIEMILPRNYKSIAEDRETKRTAATLGFDD